MKRTNRNIGEKKAKFSNLWLRFQMLQEQGWHQKLFFQHQQENQPWHQYMTNTKIKTKRFFSILRNTPCAETNDLPSTPEVRKIQQYTCLAASVFPAPDSPLKIKPVVFKNNTLVLQNRRTTLKRKNCYFKK